MSPFFAISWHNEQPTLFPLFYRWWSTSIPTRNLPLTRCTSGRTMRRAGKCSFGVLLARLCYTSWLCVTRKPIREWLRFSYAASRGCAWTWWRERSIWVSFEVVEGVQEERSSLKNGWREKGTKFLTVQKLFDVVFRDYVHVWREASRKCCHREQSESEVESLGKKYWNRHITVAKMLLSCFWGSAWTW